MRRVGIVCEYNPFHKGHFYQLEETHRLLGEDTAVICVMSGDFVQRGEAAAFDKFTRAEAACRCGADLVAELPLPWCLSSAEGFALGAVTILNALGCETLSFGSESAELDRLESLAAFVVDPETETRIHRRMDGDASLSYARARQLIAAETPGDTAALLTNPNDILAIEYLKAIRKTGASMQALPIRRKGAGHDSTAEDACCSAMQLRQMLRRGEDPSPYIPDTAMAVFQREREAGRKPDVRLMEIALLSRLYRLRPEEFDALPDAGGGAGRRLYQALRHTGSLSAAVAEASSKRYTAARMRRMALCAALGLCAEDTKAPPPYIRILGSNEKGRACLSALRGKTDIALINKAAEVRKCGIHAEKIFTLGADAHDLYNLTCPGKEAVKPGEDWRRTQTIV